jgi:hypothetical protein
MEAVLHLCAAGLGPSSLRILMIDPDAANGNGTRVKQMLDSYLKCQRLFGGKIGSMEYFKTTVDLVQTGGPQDGLNVWNPVASDKTFGDILNLALLRREEQDIANLFFTQKELATNLEKGFRGHPAIGAAAMSLLPLYLKQKPWDQIAEKIRIELNAGDAPVVIAGSVFGGTGASAIHPLARFLKSIPEMGKHKLRIGAVALVPYFQFTAAAAGGAARNGELAAKAERFALATRAAVEFYEHLRSSGDWDFDAMYWLGDDATVEVPYSVGGERQENPAHIVDLLGALAVIQFLKTPPSDGACRFAGPRESDTPPSAAGKNIVYWDDVPMGSEERKQAQSAVTQFLAMGGMHLGFVDPLLDVSALDKGPYHVPWYLDRFARLGDYLTKPETRAELSAFGEFFARHHLPWWEQILRPEPERIRLVNRGAIVAKDGALSVDMRRLGHMDFPAKFDERPAGTLDFVDSFFSDMVSVARKAPGDRGSAAYVSVLARAANRFYKREYLKNA